jgi:hypothetical protein
MKRLTKCSAVHLCDAERTRTGKLFIPPAKRTPVRLMSVSERPLMVARVSLQDANGVCKFLIQKGQVIDELAGEQELVRRSLDPSARLRCRWPQRPPSRFSRPADVRYPYPRLPGITPDQRARARPGANRFESVPDQALDCFRKGGLANDPANDLDLSAFAVDQNTCRQSSSNPNLRATSSLPRSTV